MKWMFFAKNILNAVLNDERTTSNVKTFLEETQPTSGMSNQPIEVEYNLPFRYRPNKRKFKPTIPNRERKKARLYQLYLRHKQRMQKLKNELYPLDNIWISMNINSIHIFIK